MRAEQHSLAALIFAYHEADDPGGGLRAALPLAGRTLLERQARIAAAAGARPIVLFVERVPAQLIAAVERLRGEGLNIVTARTPEDAADAVHHHDALLVVGDGIVPDADHIAQLVSAGGAALLTVPDFGADDRFERIDAESRWAGLAMIDGGLLKATASMLHEWDFQSTLLRKAVQRGARQFSIRTDEALVVAERAADLEEVQARIVAGAGGEGPDWASAYLLAPAEDPATRLLMPTAVSPEWLRLGALVLLGGSAFAFGKGWLLSGLLLALAATPLPGVARRLARLRMHLGRYDRRWDALLPGLAGLAIVLLGYGASASRGWGCIALAIMTVAFMLALRAEASPATPRRIALAEWKGMAWLMVPFGVTGFWTAGLVFLACYAAASFFWAQRHAHTTGPAAAQD